MISSRNQLPGVIKSVSRGVVNAEIVMVTGSGLEITSIITVGSCVMMGLRPGMAVVAVIKASDVMVAVGHGFSVSTRNHIPGRIKSITPGVVNSEIVIDAEGTELVSVITEASVERLKLTESMSVSALVKASNVIVMTG